MSKRTDNDHESMIGPYIYIAVTVVLGIVLLPTLPIFMAFMLALWPVLVVAAAIAGIINMIRNRQPRNIQQSARPDPSDRSTDQAPPFRRTNHGR